MFYPQLNENPNTIINPEVWKNNKKHPNYKPSRDREMIEWHSEGTIPFVYYDGELFTGLSDETHWDLAAKYEKNREIKSKTYNGRGNYAGRLFTEQKVITFWEFPEDYEKLIKIVEDLENATGLNIIGDSEWEVEIPREKMEKPEVSKWGKYTQYQGYIGSVYFIPINDYMEGPKRSKAELESPHESPIRNKSYGSGKKYQDLQKQKRFMTAESFYPQLKKEK